MKSRWLASPASPTAPRRGQALLASLAGAFAAIGALGALGACIDVPDEQEPQCERSADCDQPAGEVCEEGVCWGDPPDVMMAAIVGPPGDADDLVPAEIPQLFIPAYGFMPELVLGTPVSIRGRVVRECELPGCTVPTAVKATIRITRPSSFPGGPGLSIVEETGPDGNFTLNLPLTRMGRPGLGDDPAYSVTISPADRGATRPTLFAGEAEILPPRRMSVVALQDTSMTLSLPAENLPVVQGKLVDGAGVGRAGYRVVARGRWVDGEPLGEVSTVAVTAADGSYRLSLAEGLFGTVVVRAEPPATSAGAAILELEAVDPTGATGLELRLPANELPPVPLSLTVKVPDGGGEMPPVKGVAVRLRYELREGASDQTATYTVEGSTGENGTVALVAIPGVVGTSWSYRLSMVPQADSLLAAVYDEPVIVGAGGPLSVPSLARRVSITGVLTDGRDAMKDVTLTVRPSRSFLLALDKERRTFVDEIAATTATTSKNGEFVVLADPVIAGSPARYSLSFQPPENQFIPSWTHPVEVAIPTGVGESSVDIGEVLTVEAANVHGRIINPGGRPVAKALVVIYKLDASCVTAGCSGTAQVIGRGVADEDGMVRIALPKFP